MEHSNIDTRKGVDKESLEPATLTDAIKGITEAAAAGNPPLKATAIEAAQESGISESKSRS